MTCLYALALTAAPLPAWIAERLATPERPARAEVEGLVPDTPKAISAAYSWVAHLIQIGDVPTYGNRNDHAWRFYARMHGYGLSEDKARELFEFMLQSSGGARPDPDDAKIEPMIADLWAGKRGDNPAGSELPLSASDVDWTAGGDSEGILKAPSEDEAREARRRRWRPMRVTELMAQPPVDMWDRDTDRMLPRLVDGGVMMIYGPDGHHKTNVLLLKMFELWAGAEKPKVAYAASEGRQGLGDRFRALCTVTGIEAASLAGLLLTTHVPMVGQAPDLESFKAVLADEGFEPDIIVVDTWATALAGEDEDTRSAALLTFTGAVGRLAAKYKALVVIVHHAGKLDKTKREGIELKDFAVRGAGAYRANTEAFVAVWCASDTNKKAVQMYVEKVRDGEANRTAYFGVSHVGSVPVLQRIGWKSYDMLVGKGRFERESVAGAIGRIGAVDRAGAVSSVTIARDLYPLEAGQDPEEHERLTGSLARQLEKAAKGWTQGGLFVEEGGQLFWFATA